ncbi:MAG: DUF2202 domain-containing protein [Myxococcales bacterium]|jgi:hypothetical protein|nr:DUF2202 domain-containing protein [Myxococcales bacterium]MBK7197642.1 DUF2202 domain-containing protein [Myxococcales bacterium]MBP6844504.1 DUF2202 domain-containing protein [Kofleriaceae bacterium]
MKSIAYALGLITALAGCGDGNDASPDGAGAALSAREQSDLRHMREEEKLARDVYDALDPNGQPFVNVQDSEQRHFDAIGGLLVTYGIDDPAAGNGVGVFTDAGLQALHDDLVARGAPSQVAALGVGCAIEELDLHDLDVARAASDHADVIAVYDNLALGSRNHLRAYFDTLTAAGGGYTPVAIDQATFDAIVTSPREQGGR